ncbi:hypothetical protein BMS_2106 [Halobacteriovorax marinus SJ]|uniref:Uncharacterized protein n=1 Tax=Halobacteriovorax marinus (strain ATCC BAA-682 / DSM 15412 / SJ) TaxID=862908 RepID=E1X3I6_HALMS|nr:hypothetical protein [Halobacteriovorax marinus]CBW26915.1 hypothetical protein BMS_2106 [Halobacteriovorax marinus SJ]
MKKIFLISFSLLVGISLDAKQADSIHIKTTYKRSKKIWGVYTLNKQVWFHGKKKFATGPKEDHVLMRKDGRFVFISPKFNSGVVSYDVNEVPYTVRKKNSFSVENINLNQVDYTDGPFQEGEPMKTTAFSCKNKWKTIECVHTLTKEDKAASIIKDLTKN